MALNLRDYPSSCLTTWLPRASTSVAVVALAALLTGCGGWQSTLNARGPEADHLAWLFWFFTIFCGVVWVLVLVALLWGVTGSQALPRLDPILLDQRYERRTAHIVAGLVGATVVCLAILTVVSFWQDARLSARVRPYVKIEVIGHQWWWQIRYLDPDPSRAFTTANEIHVPVNTPVSLKLLAHDVIHSFWVPNLAGKMDLIPGQTNVLMISASRPGVYRGQCAEFCGTQHAKMGLRIVAQNANDFAEWRRQQLQPARVDADLNGAGKQAFFASGCFLCHTVRGTDAAGRLGPDLTHVGSRMALAADTIPNSVGHVAGWIADPQAIKPGNFMPQMTIKPGDVDVLSHYLEALK
jgi:cytochrome c oxidase subunit 2